MKIPAPWPNDKPLWPWQEEAHGVVIDRFERNVRDTLIVATPGAGKTRLGIRVAYTLLTSGIKRIVVVAPTDHIKKQWVDELAAFGIQVVLDWNPRREWLAADYHGVATTYQQVYSSFAQFRRLCGEVPTLVILDEIHHAGDSDEITKIKTWGDALRRAFEVARHRLLLSGTPFRSDYLPIPFVQYDPDDKDKGLKSKADLTYGYGRALSDSVCRLVSFPSHDGFMEWERDGTSAQARFTDGVSKAVAKDRLKTALRTGWLEEVIFGANGANAKLDEIRQGEHRNAGGLVLATNVPHANAIKALFVDRGLAAPLVVTYEDPQASELIDAFKVSSDKWIIAVQMISEGVDIPRLRVCVYATTVMTELRFRQAVGRIARMIKDLLEQTAYFYISADPTHIAYAREIQKERDHVLGELEELLRKQGDGTGSGSITSFTPLASSASQHDTILAGDVISTKEIAHTKQVLSQVGHPVPPGYPIEALVHLLRAHDRLRGETPPSDAQASTPAAEPPLHLRKAAVRRAIKQEVSRIVKLRLAVGTPTPEEVSADHKTIFIHLMNRDGGTQDTLTLDQLKARFQYVTQWRLELEAKAKKSA